MSESAIRAEIAAIVGGVADIGKVYDYERHASSWAKFIQLFKATIGGQPQIRGWEISRVRVAETLETLGGGPAATDNKHTYAIQGYLGVNDAEASEKTFEALIEEIRAAFRANPTLNGAADGHDYIQAETIDTRMFGSVLCHYAKLLLTVTEQL